MLGQQVVGTNAIDALPYLHHSLLYREISSDIHFVSKSAEVDIAAILRDFVKFSLVTAVDDHGGSGFSTIGLTHVIV